MKLIFAQGNPGSSYARTRHNIGFRIIEALALEHDAVFRPVDKYKAHIATISVGDEKVLLVLPQTFYNETGQSARGLIDFYKLDPASDLLVVHDELSLPFGTVRVRSTGSDAGNNGIKSLNAHLGASYHRLRVGVWNERRDIMGDSDFVLSTFSKEEEARFTTNILPKTLELVEEFIRGSMEPTSHRI